MLGFHRGITNFVPNFRGETITTSKVKIADLPRIVIFHSYVKLPEGHMDEIVSTTTCPIGLCVENGKSSPRKKNARCELGKWRFSPSNGGVPILFRQSQKVDSGGNFTDPSTRLRVVSAYFRQMQNVTETLEGSQPRKDWRCLTIQLRYCPTRAQEARNGFRGSWNILKRLCSLAVPEFQSRLGCASYLTSGNLNKDE